MEAQLQQSIPKKDHEEIVSKMQTTIDELDGQVNRIRDELQRTKGITETINALGAQIAAQKEMLDSQGQTVSNQTQIIDVQNKAIEALVGKLSQETIPNTMYHEALSKTHELEEKISQYVAKSDFETIQQKVAELTELLGTTVPKSEYEALQAQFSNYVPKSEYEVLQAQLSNYVPKESYEQIQTALANSVPRDQFLASETKVQELESRLSDSVSKALYDELNTQMALVSLKAQEIQATAVELVAENSVPIAAPEPIVEAPKIEVVEAVPIVETPQV